MLTRPAEFPLSSSHAFEVKWDGFRAIVSTIGVTYVVFDVLVHARESTMTLPYIERRQLLERLRLNGPGWCTAEVFDDGEALFAAVVEQGLEGIVAKPRTSTYRPGEPGWLKVKNRAYWRFGQELERSRRS